MEKKMKQTPETIVLLNFVCEDIQKAARLVRDSGIYTMVMPYTTPVERVMQEKPVGLIVCADKGVPAREADLKRFKSIGLPLLELEITKDNLAAQAEKAIAFCKEKCGCHGLWKLENFIDEAVADIRAQVGDQKVVLGLSGGVDEARPRTLRRMD